MVVVVMAVVWTTRGQDCAYSATCLRVHRAQGLLFPFLIDLDRILPSLSVALSTTEEDSEASHVL